MQGRYIEKYFFETLNSTNDKAKQILNDNPMLEKIYVRSEVQESGRGQFARIWESEKGKNLLISIGIRAVSVPIEQSNLISELAAIAVFNVLSRKNIIQISIKWPNDIYVGNKKVAGILIENTFVGNKIEKTIIGIGLNVNQTEFSEGLPNPVSMKQITGEAFDIGQIGEEIVNEVFSLLNRKSEIHLLYNKYLYRLGELTEFFNSENNVFLGVILGVDASGCLEVRVENARVNTYMHGEVSLKIPSVN
ncbi:MAG: biotin--[acetyl-CoA-carboxylase] ligase [Bacteroidales bacterium]|nr:biotin--[acetyl-CoA-carboxylase] ligase [Bacteroidales bacterium]